MADGKGVAEGTEATGSQTADAGNPALARGAAGSEQGAHHDGPQNSGGQDGRGDLEERRETQQVLRPSADGMGDGLVKDQS